MRTIPAQTVVDAVARAAIDANYHLGTDVVAALERARDEEPSPLGREVLFAQVGEDVRVEGGLEAALTEGVRTGTADGYLRRTVCDPFTRQNTGDSTPAAIHVTLVPGDELVIDYLAKGGGSENMSRAGVLTPAAGEPGVVDYAVETARRGAVNACPPITLGIGIGGDLETAAILAKRALTRPLGEPADEPRLARIEAEVLERVNRLGIGPAGLGGRTTALAVHAALMPCHIASLPVAVVLQCHAHRHRRIQL